MAKLLKDLYDDEYINLLCKNITKHYPTFHSSTFKKDIFNDEWQSKELKTRMRHISTTMGRYIEMPYSHATILLQAVFREMNHAYGLENMIFQDFVVVYGLDDFKTSMSALEAFTIGSSSEFAIREFLLKYEDETMKQMRVWAKSENEHLRRLASEGCRPRLPWAVALPRFKKEPSKIIKILELLKNDSSAYVRKSVANNLNDISKDNPEIVKAIAKEWIGNSKESDAILKHGCRTLLKQADGEILKCFGLTKAKHVLLKNFSLTQEVKMGEVLGFSFELESEQNLGLLRLEYSISFLRKNGSRNDKIFKISEANYQLKNKQFQKSYSFRPITTRAYYKGAHKLAIIINGVVLKEVEFTLL
jgi:3-methyladenine DNA glycosylase AlkC